MNTFKMFCKIFHYASFLVFSYNTFKDFIEGTTEFKVYQEPLDELKFPDLTFCPRQEKSLSYLKARNLREDLNLTPDAVDGPFIFNILKENLSLLSDYSFELEESIVKNKLV